MPVRLLFPILSVICLLALGCAQPQPEVVEVPVTVEVSRDVPVTVEIEREVKVDREVPVTVEIERVVEVTREVQIPVTVEVEKDVIVDREVPVTVEVERTVEVTREVPVTVVHEVEREIVREIPVTVVVEEEVEVIREIAVTVEVPVTVEVEKVVEKEVEIIRNTLGGVSMASLRDAFYVLDADGDDRLFWDEACAGLGDDLDLMANIWLILIRDSWGFSDEEELLDAYSETLYWTNEEICERWDWQEY